MDNGHRHSPRTRGIPPCCHYSLPKAVGCGPSGLPSSTSLVFPSLLPAAPECKTMSPPWRQVINLGICSNPTLTKGKVQGIKIYMEQICQTKLHLNARQGTSTGSQVQGSQAFLVHAHRAQPPFQQQPAHLEKAPSTFTFPYFHFHTFTFTLSPATTCTPVLCGFLNPAVCRPMLFLVTNLSNLSH